MTTRFPSYDRQKKRDKTESCCKQKHVLKRGHETLRIVDLGQVELLSIECPTRCEYHACCGDSEHDAQRAHHLTHAAGDTLLFAGNRPHDKAHVGGLQEAEPEADES